MMRAEIATVPGGPGENEDWAAATPDALVVVDGQTARTDTGCVHGTAWYARRLGLALVAQAGDPARLLVDAIANAIGEVADEHAGCDLTHPGTPGAVVGVARLTPAGLGYALLGDVTLVVESATAGLWVATDDRLTRVAVQERDAGTALPYGSPERTEALVAMKRAEQRAKNTPGGFWVASADPDAARHAVTGFVPAPRWVALLSDGAARLHTLGGVPWAEILNTLATEGPAGLIGQVRAIEADDPQATRWPRTKPADDATVAYLEPTADTQGTLERAAAAIGAYEAARDDPEWEQHRLAHGLG